LNLTNYLGELFKAKCLNINYKVQVNYFNPIALDYKYYITGSLQLEGYCVNNL